MHTTLAYLMALLLILQTIKDKGYNDNTHGKILSFLLWTMPVHGRQGYRIVGNFTGYNFYRTPVFKVFTVQFSRMRVIMPAIHLYNYYAYHV